MTKKDIDNILGKCDDYYSIKVSSIQIGNDPFFDGYIFVHNKQIEIKTEGMEWKWGLKLDEIIGFTSAMLLFRGGIITFKI